MKILVIEDEPTTGDYLQRGLTESGFAVHLSRTGTEGEWLAVKAKMTARRVASSVPPFAAYVQIQ